MYSTCSVSSLAFRHIALLENILETESGTKGYTCRDFPVPIEKALAAQT